MKPRYFQARIDLDAGANIRRMYAYIRTLDPTYQSAGRFKRKIDQKKAAKLIRIK